MDIGREGGRERKREGEGGSVLLVMDIGREGEKRERGREFKYMFH